MKVLIFSDSHLSNSFDQLLFEKLTEVITKVDLVVINGDFFDGYVCTIKDFTQSEWRKLFPYLLDKNAIYIFGNHDTKEMTGEEARKFSTKQVDKFELKLGKKELTITHGHRFAPEFNAKHPRLAKYFVRFYPILYWFSKNRGLLGNIYRRFMAGHYNKLLDSVKAYAQENKQGTQGTQGNWGKHDGQGNRGKHGRQHEQILLVGHTHNSYVDLSAGLVCIGPFANGVANFVIIDTVKESIKVYQEEYDKN